MKIIMNRSVILLSILHFLIMVNSAQCMAANTLCCYNDNVTVKSQIDSVYALIDEAGRNYRIGNNREAFSLLNKGRGILDSLSVDPDNIKPILYALIDDREGLFYMDIDPNKALQLNAKANSAYIANGFDNTTFFATAAHNRGCIFSRLADFKAAAEAFEVCISLDMRINKKVTAVSINSLIAMGSLCLAMGEIEKADEVLSDANKAVLDLFGRGSEADMILQRTRSIYYYNIGDFEQSLKFAEESLGIAEAIYGSNRNIAVAGSLLFKGIALLGLKRYDDCISALSECINIYDDLGITKFTTQYESRTYLGVAYILSGNIDAGMACFNNAKEILEGQGLSCSALMADMMSAFAGALLKVNNPICLSIYKDTIRLAEEIGWTTNQIYLEMLSNYMKASILFGNADQAIVSIAYNALSDQYKRNISLLPARDRTSFIRVFDGLTNNIFSIRRNDEVNGYLYDYLLVNKGILLGTSMAFKRGVESSNDDELKAKYRLLVNTNSRIRNLLAEPKSIDMEMLSSLQQQAVEIEKELIASSKQYADYSRWLSFSWSDLKASLPKRTALIEFVEYCDVIDGSNRLAALVLRRDHPFPTYVELGKSENIEHLLTKSYSSIYTAGPTSDSLYQLIWAPIAKALKGINCVYFSPYGIINNISLENLLSQNGRRLGEVYKLHRVSSTKDFSTNPISGLHSAVLYGGLQYDMSPELMVENAHKYEDYSFYSTRNTLPNMSNTRSGWGYLPGTVVEISKIAETLLDKDFKVTIYQGTDGSEESFKALSGQHTSMLHIATHGFYTHQDESLNGFVIDGSSISAMYPYKDPMLRSGLLLSGANNVLGGSAPLECEDGILTSAEIAELDLSATEIAVLSACDTGLGDITEEGVYGLQRAFKNAGVKTIIMSLWKVDDDATRMMMTVFYSRLLDGMSKYDAFEAAKKAVASKYPEPYYWAGFIMLD